MEEDTFWWRLINLNPAIWRGLVMAVVAVLTSFGILISTTIPDSIIGLIVIVVAMLQALWTRQAVTPNAKVVSYLPDPADRFDLAAGEATTTASPRDIVEASTTKGG